MGWESLTDSVTDNNGDASEFFGNGYTNKESKPQRRWSPHAQAVRTLAHEGSAVEIFVSIA